MQTNCQNRINSILILADFADGREQASRFAVDYLYKDDSCLLLLQTFQSPDWGYFMMRKIGTQLREIAQNELLKLKRNIVEGFGIPRRKVNILTVEGSLNSILRYKPIINRSYNVVLGTMNAFPDSASIQNRKLEKILDQATNPIFIVANDLGEHVPKKVLFVGNPNKLASDQLLEQVMGVCKKSEAELELLFVLRKGVPKISDSVLNAYAEKLSELNYQLKQVAGYSKYKGLKRYLDVARPDLIVVQNDKEEQFSQLQQQAYSLR